MIRLTLSLLAAASLFTGCTNRYPDSPVTDLPSVTPAPAGSPAE